MQLKLAFLVLGFMLLLAHVWGNSFIYFFAEEKSPQVLQGR